MQFLLKFSHAPGTRSPAASIRLGISGAQLQLKHLFDVPAPARTGFAIGDETVREHRWYLTEIAPDRALGFDDSRSAWDIAHRLMDEHLGADTKLLAVEPDFEQTWPVTPPPWVRAPTPLAVAPCTPQGPNPELPQGNKFGWHLEDNFTQLRKARNVVMGSGTDVTIAHLDTGYDPKHKTLPEHIDLSRQKNFIQGEHENDASDRTPDGFLLNRGHGTGTLGILAGAKLSGMQPATANTNDYLGGTPLAKVVPIRIANSVVHLWTSSVAVGIDYARQINADVISMSMGGLPSSAWADAVNAAYEAGIVIVCAAGNNYNGWPTSSIVWPAQFQRVIAACGIMADGRPYFNLPPWLMQGCYGPLSKMNTSMAAFTPNIPWPEIGCVNVIDLDGAGTSSATPQIAAAAALWLRKYKGTMNYSKKWMCVEAVRRALFESADDLQSDGPHEFFGRGILRANGALGIGLSDEASLKKTPADHAGIDFLRPSTGFALAADPRRLELLQLEMAHIAIHSAAARDAVPDPGLPPEQVSGRQRRQFLDAILDENKTSGALRYFLESELGEASTTVSSSAIPSARTTVEAKKAEAPKTPRVDTGVTLPRQMRRRPPGQRRLQIFAVDPSLSNRLETAALNRTTVEIPWEISATSDNLVQPGPVGEYIEVVDVDPSSGCAYDPVDLNDPFLLAQNGLAPSEGNPQFHQQMVYAVAMQTIETFALALGRSPLWATKRVKSLRLDPATGKHVTDYTKHYIPRLRIYPHALRQANAYYSPDKVALLFGYFPELKFADGDALGGMVFSCLSHDIIAHETTHALLDGLHRRYQESTNIDVLAFHEAFADIVAIFQHFTLPDVLRFDIARTRGDLARGTFLADLARQFGEAIGRSKALRSAIDVDPTKINYASTTEPHERGSVLVAAVFDAFLIIYQKRVEDLLRIATGGTGVLQPGALHPDLVGRLAIEANKSAAHTLQICIRALDYCPPVDITFPEYLRALITADADLVRKDRFDYRVAFLEAFRARGIYPDEVRTLSVESLQWGSPAVQPAGLSDLLRTMEFGRAGIARHEAYRLSRLNAAKLHEWMREPGHISDKIAEQFGLNRSKRQSPEYDRDPEGRPKFEVHSVRQARRVTPDGQIKSEVVVVLTQRRNLSHQDTGGPQWFRGGATLILDPQHDDEPIRYSIVKSIGSKTREERQRAYQKENLGLSLRSLYFGSSAGEKEPFAMLHIGDA